MDTKNWYSLQPYSQASLYIDHSNTYLGLKFHQSAVFCKIHVPSLENLYVRICYVNDLYFIVHTHFMHMYVRKYIHAYTYIRMVYVHAYIHY